jgi:transaldolase
LEHLLCAFALEVQLVTVPVRLLEEWAVKSFPMPNRDFTYKAIGASGKPLNAMPYRMLKLNQPWENFDIAHELTTKGIQKFVEDYRSTLKKTA